VVVLRDDKERRCWSARLGQEWAPPQQIGGHELHLELDQEAPWQLVVAFVAELAEAESESREEQHEAGLQLGAEGHRRHHPLVALELGMPLRSHSIPTRPRRRGRSPRTRPSLLRALTTLCCYGCVE
jgi:hypothetical protein